MRRAEVCAATQPGSRGGIAKGVEVRVETNLDSGGLGPAELVGDLAGVAFGGCEDCAVAIGLSGEEGHVLAADAAPGEASRGEPEGRAGIVEGQDVAIGVSFDAHLVGAELAHADSVAFAGADELEEVSLARDGPAIAANRVEAQGAADGEAEGTGGDAHRPGIAE